MPGPAPNRGLLIALAYLWLLALVPLLTADDDEVKWHAKHGLVLAGAEFLLFSSYVLLTITAAIATLGLGFLLAMVLPLAWIGVLALHAAAIVKGINGTRLQLPVISDLANRF
jgi:uncharacterized membrane protein